MFEQFFCSSLPTYRVCVRARAWADVLLLCAAQAAAESARPALVRDCTEVVAVEIDREVALLLVI